MPINDITQTISGLPAAGRRGVDVQTQFVIKQEDFQDHLQGTTVNELNTLKDQLNSRIGEINSTTTTMNGYANTASAGASTATTKAGEASTSASGALTSRNQAETFKNDASTSASTATTKASEASASATSASASASTASTKASEASASASTASTKASEASTQAGIATTKANEASTSASTATTSRNQAETFAQQAQASAASVDANNIQTQLNGKLGVNSNAASATKLFTPRHIGGVNFDGTADINLPGVNVKGNQDTSGTADYAKYQLLIGGATTCDAYFKATPAGKTSFNEIANYADAPTTTDWYFLHNIRHSNSSNYWGAQIAYSLNNSTGNKIWQRTIDAGTWSAWTRVDVSVANISELANNIGYITADGRAYPRKVGGGNMNFTWLGQGGQPTWLWGGSDGENMYIYNPSNFNVNYANSAGYAAAFTTAVGSAPSYACRAWVNFNGTETVYIRASGNVSSIIDNGVGDYTVNFTTAMPDANYCAVPGQADASDRTQACNSLTTTSVRVFNTIASNAWTVDAYSIFIHITR